MTETGGRRVFGGRDLRWLRVLRDDLWTARADPLPSFGRLRRVPHGVLCFAAFWITFGGTAQLTDNGRLGFGSGFPIALAQGGAVALALWRPVAAWWLATTGSVLGAVAVHFSLTGGAAHDFTWPWTAAGIIAQLLVLLLLALRVRTRVSVEALSLTVLVTLVLQGVWESPHPQSGDPQQSTGPLAIALSAVAVLLGIALRSRREARAEVGRLTTLTAEERARRTLLEERNRIARELHDVVAHHMSVISIQAQVAPHLVENPPDELRENLEGIRNNALEALTELRRVLGVLRSEDPGADAPADGGNDPHSPQPTLDRLDALVENTRAAGLAVTTRTTGERRPLPSGVELSAYRIVQEALSNVLRHAPGASASVEVAYVPLGLRVEVVNSRPLHEAPVSPGAGHGLLGMRERAAMLGGDLSAQPRPDGGYQVSAFLPVDPRAAGPDLPDAPDPAPDPKDDSA
ncbi:sensor histidine kinase [Streptomyces sp. NPDC001351]|uniref:sensor histidine kinase n=1 Tax=Streptomyces sp. NPDC001351 TaxID=3364564 RepID=UPI0036769697